MSETPAERRHRERMELNDALDRAEHRTAYLNLEATGQSADELWQRTGFARCDDCGHLMRAATLVSLPEHRCAQRQQRRPAPPA